MIVPVPEGRFSSGSPYGQDKTQIEIEVTAVHLNLIFCAAVGATPTFLRPGLYYPAKNAEIGHDKKARHAEVCRRALAALEGYIEKRRSAASVTYA